MRRTLRVALLGAMLGVVGGWGLAGGPAALRGHDDGGGSQPRDPADGGTREEPRRGCCKHCVRGKPCGDTCISRNKVCHVGPGCAC